MAIRALYCIIALLYYPRFQRLDPDAEARSVEALRSSESAANRKWCRIFFEGSHEFSRSSILCSMLPVAWHRHIWICGIVGGAIDTVDICRWYGWGESIAHLFNVQLGLCGLRHAKSQRKRDRPRGKNPRGQSRYRFPESRLWIRWWGSCFTACYELCRTCFKVS